jgi:hypothetical protein
MAFDAIGSESFLTMEGAMPQPQALEVEELTRPGVRGRAFRQVEYRGEPWPVHTEADVTSAAAASTLISTYKAMQGTIVTVIYRDRTYSNYLVLDVTAGDVRVMALAVGGLSGGGYLVSADWTLVYAGT